MLITLEWSSALYDLVRLLLFNCHDVILDDMQVLVEDVENNLFRHHLTQRLQPSARQELAHNLDKHRQRLVFDCTGL